jgi:hypothetical protein
MRVKILQRGEKPLIIEGFDQLVVETDGGAPVAVVSRYGPEGAYIVSSVDDDKRFQEVLRSLGLHKTLIVTNIGDMLRPGCSLPDLS